MRTTRFFPETRNRNLLIAFSLVELSIVLVILGLLTGGILAGQSLIRAAELRSVASDYQRYSAAVNTFRDKYMALPGDMRNATDFWGIAAGTTGRDATCYSVVSTDKATCNGNGNGRLFIDDNVTDSSRPEWFRAWQHLANAGLVEGSYTGTAELPSPGALPGKNIPAGRIGNTGFTLMSYDATATNTGWWAGRYDGFAFGIPNTSGGIREASGLVLKPEEAWGIDTKLDDGKPAYGLVRDFKAHTNCHNGTDPAAAEYSVSTGNIACSLFLSLGNAGS